MKLKNYLLVLSAYIVIKQSFLIPEKNSITFFDIGQGDAILINIADTTMLIDGGPDFEISSHIASRYLFNTCNLSAIILTHPHADHLKGLTRILDTCNVLNVLYNPISYDSKLYSFFKERTVGAKTLYAGDKFSIGDVTMFVLWPSKEAVLASATNNINDLSTILLLDLGDFEVLFTGDAEEYALSSLDYTLLNNIVQDGLDVLKVPHHGGASSLNKAFYTSLHPKVCVISSGYPNTYGHPHLEVLNYLTSIKCEIKRTYQVGNIEILIDRL